MTLESAHSSDWGSRMKPTDKEIKQQADHAHDVEMEGTGFSGLSYEEGVYAALEWVLGETEEKPYPQEN